MKNLLVGNTTVIEHAGTYIQWSRTISKNYQSKKAEIGFVLPKGLSLKDGYILAKAIVNRQLGLKVKNTSYVDELCELVFNQSINDFERT